MGIDNLFFSWDLSVLGLYHSFAEATHGFFTPFLHLVSLAGEKGLLFILLSLGMICFPKTRRTGCICLLSLALGALVTNVTLKNLVARPRPFVTSEQIALWWQSVGAYIETDFSFPSGHTTATCAFTTGLVYARGRKWFLLAVPCTFLMGFSRNYLMAHYPTDVLAGVLVGILAATLAYVLLRRAYTGKRKDVGQ